MNCYWSLFCSVGVVKHDSRKQNSKCLVTLSPQMLNTMLSTVRKYMKTLFRFLSFQKYIIILSSVRWGAKKYKLLAVVIVGFSLIY